MELDTPSVPHPEIPAQEAAFVLARAAYDIAGLTSDSDPNAKILSNLAVTLREGANALYRIALREAAA